MNIPTDAKHRVAVLATVATVAVATLAVVSQARAWDAIDYTPAMDCGYTPSTYGRAAGTWGSQAMVETPNNADLDCALMYVRGYYRDASTGYQYMGELWLGSYGPQLNAWGDVVEVTGDHNICDVGYTNCNGYESTLVYQ